MQSRYTSFNVNIQSLRGTPSRICSARKTQKSTSSDWNDGKDRKKLNRDEDSNLHSFEGCCATPLTLQNVVCK
ncbi:uncharacterized protein PHALS_00805 [Plasmopara halstedii]|uniref:Uncharacterized protein n=1 Tax=Plasmopara halstedii TaxID=4781 RepID=A0A0P1AU05_PLAHL|nr:uncharacterized protein PHALS_00805 [Plasmopara halstedii]CEG44438.1 hypothetical protein PHALS_00805 [Plasmopara halstedii]|eukprot:XP_024580807.1 hypothetical protein PHALS_00805 [Plasmopara halstedii]